MSEFRFWLCPSPSILNLMLNTEVTSQYSEGSLFQRSIIPKVHWSEGALFRRCISPKVHWSEGALVRRCISPKISR